jgi:hypothetical protein
MATNLSNQTNGTVRLVEFCDDIPVEYVIATFVGATIFGSFNNILVTLVVWKNKEMQNPTNLLLTNNAVAEFLQVLVSCTMVVLFNLAARTKTFSPQQEDVIFKSLSSMRVLYILPILISMITLAIVAVERYNALIYPMKIRRRLNKRGAKISICVVWVASVTFSLPVAEGGFIGAELHIELFYYVFGLSTATVFISGFVVIFCYGRIIFAIFITKTVCNQLNQTCPVARAQDSKHKKNIVKMLLSVTLIFVFTKFPPLSYSFLILSGIDPGFHCSILLIFFGHISALLNPLVYLVYNSNYRDGTRSLLRSWFCTVR